MPLNFAILRIAQVVQHNPMELHTLANTHKHRLSHQPLFHSPNLLCLLPNSSMHCLKSSFVISGNNLSKKMNSAYESCHKRKLLILFSPPCLISKSGSFFR